MKNLVREVPLANGLTVRFFDATRRYFGDYHKVRVKVVCEVPLSAGLFEDAASFGRAEKLLGEKVQYQREIEHQGVPTLAVAETVQRVIGQFVEHSLCYFESESFPKRFVQSELNRVAGKGKGYLRLTANG